MVSLFESVTESGHANVHACVYLTVTRTEHTKRDHLEHPFHDPKMCCCSNQNAAIIKRGYCFAVPIICRVFVLGKREGVCETGSPLADTDFQKAWMSRREQMCPREAHHWRTPAGKKTKT